MPPDLRSLLNKLWHCLPGQTRGARLLWLWHLIALIGLIMFLRDWKVPAHWTGIPLTGKIPKFNDIVHMGLWEGGIAHCILSALILTTVRWWGRAKCPVIETRLPNPQARAWWFWPALLIILVSAAVIRWPRMGHSYWGDEGWALRFSGYGVYEPMAGKNMQGPLKFVPVKWKDVLWDDQTGGNHYLFSILQKITLDTWRSVKGLPPTAFDESISRLPLFAGGLASIVALALFLSWLGRPRAGLLGALFFALHSWHIRYSTEARGYILMLLFFILSVWALLYALQSQRWRGWLLLGMAEFLAIYAWKVAALPFMAITIVVAVYLLLQRGEGAVTWADRLSRLARLLVVNLTAAAVFIFLVAPCSLQSERAIERLKHTGKVMDAHWLHKSLSGLLFGVPWHRESIDNLTETPLGEALAASPVLVGFALAAAMGLLLAGIVLLFRQRSLHAWIWLSVLVAGAVGASVFKWGMGIEWIHWYFFFIILPLAVFTGLALDALWGKSAALWAPSTFGRSRAVAAVCLALAVLAPVAIAAMQVPHIRLMQVQPYESHREAFQLTRGQHEPWGYEGASKVITCHLWRHIDLYDPRADTYVRTAARLHERMAEADQMGGHLYYVVGQGLLFRSLQKEVMDVLEDPKFFEHKASLWAEEDILTLEVYHYLGAGAAKP